MMEQSLPVWLQGRQDEKNLTAGFMRRSVWKESTAPC